MLDRLGDRSSQTRAFVWLEAAQLEQYSELDSMREDAERARGYFKAHTVERMWSNRFQSLNIAARAYQLSGDFERAEAGFVEALHELEALGQQATAWSVTPLVWLAETQWQASRFDAAEANLREALALSLLYNGAANGATVQTQTKLAALLHQTGRRAQGLRLLREVEPKLGEAGTHALATWRSFYGVVLLREGRVAEAEQLFADLVAELRERLPRSLLMARALLLRSSARRLLGRYAESVEDSRTALQLWTAGAGLARPSAFAPFHLAHVRARLAAGEAAAAQSSLSALQGDDLVGADAAEALIVRAQASLLSEQFSEAQTLAQQALALLRALPLLGRLPQLEAEALQALGQARLQLGDAEPGCSDLAFARELRARQALPESPGRAELERAQLAAK
jgi:serine/threonine-protein kinase